MCQRASVSASELVGWCYSFRLGPICAYLYVREVWCTMIVVSVSTVIVFRASVRIEGPVVCVQPIWRDSEKYAAFRGLVQGLDKKHPI
jgi:hypothetical protein